MRLAVILIGLLFWQHPGPVSPYWPSDLEIGRTTYVDGGNGYYFEVLRLRPDGYGTRLDRISVNPPASQCDNRPRIRYASSELAQTLPQLLGEVNPCAIPKQILASKAKRCKKCMVFAFAKSSMRASCGGQQVQISEDVLGALGRQPISKGIYDAWSRRLEAGLENQLGSRPDDDLMSPALAPPVPEGPRLPDEVRSALASGAFDGLFNDALVSALYHRSLARPVNPTITLVSLGPTIPIQAPLPEYPPIARLARVEGPVRFRFSIDASGRPASISFVDGHVMLTTPLRKSMRDWRFPPQSVGTLESGEVRFAANCPQPKLE